MRLGQNCKIGLLAGLIRACLIVCTKPGPKSSTAPAGQIWAKNLVKIQPYRGKFPYQASQPFGPNRGCPRTFRGPNLRVMFPAFFKHQGTLKRIHHGDPTSRKTVSDGSSMTLELNASDARGINGTGVNTETTSCDLVLDIPGGVSISLMNMFYDRHVNVSVPNLFVTNSEGIHLVRLAKLRNRRSNEDDSNISVNEPRSASGSANQDSEDDFLDLRQVDYSGRSRCHDVGCAICVATDY